MQPTSTASFCMQIRFPQLCMHGIKLCADSENLTYWAIALHAGRKTDVKQPPALLARNGKECGGCKATGNS
ncbi:MAG: hypothetical protein DUD39_10325 [Coriobacteriaceae bacterium]|nr:MAG: hypothetical protein DUD39_10325 [Coriobacteriaceae bacterium]